MTPEKKAKNLFDGMYAHCDQISLPKQYKQAKQCALVAVDEILDVISAFAYSNTIYDDFEKGKMTRSDNTSPELYWVKVKEEIEKL